MVPRFWDRILKIFGTGFGQSWTVWGLFVIPGLRSLGFVVCFDVILIWRRMEQKKWFMAVKGPRGALFYMGPRFGPFSVLLLEK